MLFLVTLSLSLGCSLLADLLFYDYFLSKAIFKMISENLIFLLIQKVSKPCISLGGGVSLLGASSKRIWWDQKKINVRGWEWKGFSHCSVSPWFQPWLLGPLDLLELGHATTLGGTLWACHQWLAGTWPITYKEWRGGENGCFLCSPALDQQTCDRTASLPLVNIPWMCKHALIIYTLGTITARQESWSANSIFPTPWYRKGAYFYQVEIISHSSWHTLNALECLAHKFCAH